jgi:hypothetical protein
MMILNPAHIRLELWVTYLNSATGTLPTVSKCKSMMKDNGKVLNNCQFQLVIIQLNIGQ